MEQRIMSIYEFHPGDVITRMIPSKPMKVIGDETFIDRAFIGEELVFIGIANGCVNVEKTNHKASNIVAALFQPTIINLPLDVYSEGWSYYVDPYTMLDNLYEKEKEQSKFKINSASGDLFFAVGSKIPEETEESLKLRLETALKNEEYEKAEKIKKELDSKNKIKKKNK